MFILVFIGYGDVFTNNSVRDLLIPSFSYNKASQQTAIQAPWQEAPAARDYEPLGIEFTDDPWWEQRDSNRTVYVAPYTGLSNTLQALASAFTISYRENINFKFVFKRDWFGPAVWDDLFSFPKVNFNHTFPDGVYYHKETKSCKVAKPLFHWKHGLEMIEWTKEPNGTGEIGCVESCCWREPPFPQTVLWFYRILRPEKYLQMKIDSFKKSQGWDKYQWVGVHVRRTDNIETMKGLLKFETQSTLQGKVNTTNADSILPIESYIATMYHLQQDYPIHKLGGYQIVKPLRFFLATDKDETRSKILEAFPEGQVVYYEHGIPSGRLRSENWGMKLAVIDMFLLASCQVLIGTPFSTFSEAAHYIGGNFFLEPNFAYQIQSQ
eukprot:g1630.t1